MKCNQDPSRQPQHTVKKRRLTLGVGTFFVDPPLDFRLSIAGPRGVLAASGIDLNGPSGFLVSFLIHAPERRASAR